jgi:hypothetical protein
MKGLLMPNRFIFRQVYYGDLSTFLDDGEIRAKNHISVQLCHQTSYQQIVDRRGTKAFSMPCGGVVNDYVPFYFSPLTSFTYTIHKGNVPLRSPSGADLGIAKPEDRIFIVCGVEGFRGSDLKYCFSNFPLNSEVPPPILNDNLDDLEKHVFWDVFDEFPYGANIPEIGYNGVCRYFQNAESPPPRQLRSQKRMAEFLVQGAVPLGLVTCVVANNIAMRDRLQQVMDASRWNIPIYVKSGCYF